MREKNRVQKGFLRKYRIGGKMAVKHLPLDFGFLKLAYGLYEDPEVLSLVSFVQEASGDAIEERIRLDRDGS